MAVDIRAWSYVDDLGTTYSRGVAKYVADQNDGTSALIGGGPITTVNEFPPFNPAIKPRTVACINVTTGKRRRVVIMDPANSPLWAGTSTTINLDDGAGVSSSYEVYSRTGERRRTRAPLI